MNTVVTWLFLAVFAAAWIYAVIGLWRQPSPPAITPLRDRQLADICRRQEVR